jgi:glycosyltransferase involved in cell wall biosynthesis
LSTARENSARHFDQPVDGFYSSTPGSASSARKNASRGARHILVFNDSTMQGHNNEHIQHLVNYWCESDFQGKLDIAVVPRFLNSRSQLAEAIRAGAKKGVGVAALDERAGLNHGQFLGFLTTGRLLRACVERVRPDKCLLTALDGMRLPLALGLRFDFPVGFGAIYFRPTFHYRQCGFTIDNRDWFRALHQKGILALAARNRHLQTIFCLDPYSVPAVKKLARGIRVLPLADPVDIPAAQFDVAAVRKSLGIQDERLLLLLFGVLTARKGTYQLLEALNLLSEPDSRKLCVVLAGKIAQGEDTLIGSKIAEIAASRPIQIIVRNEHVPESQLDRLFAAADLVLAPYQRHVGNSGVLVRAAAAGVPILTQDYGLLGELVRRWRLGFAVDTSRPAEIAAAIRRMVAAGSHVSFDPAQAQSFASANASRRFASTILDDLVCS